MMNKRFILLMIALLVIASTGCRKSIPLETYSGGVSIEQPTMEKVKTAIIRAGASLGWAIVPADKGQLEGSLNVRAHKLVVTIDYSETAYRVNYKSSVNLDYKDGKIHPQYRNWVLNLQRQIDVEMASLNAR